MKSKWFISILVCFSVVSACAQNESAVGLTGTYRQRNDKIVTDPFGGAPVAVRVDKEINQAWTKPNLPTGIGSYWWSIHWVGSIIPEASGGHVFRLTADEYARIMLDGRIILSSFDQAPTTVRTSDPVTLTSGRESEIEIEFVNRLGEASFLLEWKKPGATEFVPVPASASRPWRPSAPQAVNKVRLYPRSGQAKSLVGAKIVGSNSGPTRGFSTLIEITDTPAENQWVEMTCDNRAPFRWIKLESPIGSWGQVAELEFYHGSQRLKGEGFGTAGSRDNSGNTWEKALDGNINTFMEGNNADDQYVGIDLGAAVQVAEPVFNPPAGGLGGPAFVKISSPTPGAYIRFSMDGKDPSIDSGSLYAGEFLVNKDTVISAIAFRPGMAPSAPVVTQYSLSPIPLKAGINTFHTGNSLTENAVSFLFPITASMGHKHSLFKFTQAGAPTDWLWQEWLKSEGKMDEKFQKSAPYTAYVIQPFPGHNRPVANELEFGGNFFELVRAGNPKAKLWVYMQWPTPKFNEGWALGTSKDLIPLNLPKPNSWDDGMRNMAKFYDLVRAGFAEKYPESEVGMLPVGLALLNLKEKIDSGKVPGMTDSLAEILTGVHLTSKSEYLAGLVFSACFYNESPVGKAVIPGTGLTEEQVRIFQQIAWETVKNHPHSGVR